MEGRNSRLDGLQASILLDKLPHLNKWTNKRIEAAAKFSQQIINKDIALPIVKEAYNHVYHLYVIRTKNRDAVQFKLKENGIELPYTILLHCLFYSVIVAGAMLPMIFL